MYFDKDEKKSPQKKQVNTKMNDEKNQLEKH